MTVYRTMISTRKQAIDLFRGGWSTTEIAAALGLSWGETQAAIEASSVWRAYSAALAAGNEFAVRHQLRRNTRGWRFGCEKRGASSGG